MAGWGYRTATAGDGLDALERVDSFTPLVVITDVIMPKLDGFKLLSRLRQEYPDIAVLLTSGYAKAINTLEANFPILRKPYQLATLARAIRGALDIEPAQLLTEADDAVE